jgi:hypothetical protein
VTRNPKLLFVTTTKEQPSAGQISLALARTGFDVATVSPKESLVRKLKAIGRHYDYRLWAPAQSVLQAVSAWSPDLLVCADDPSVRLLHALYRQASPDLSPAAGTGRLVRLIETSLGDPATFEIVRKKSELIPLAQSMGLRCPRTSVVTDFETLARTLESAVYPVVLKTDETSAGSGVRIASDRAEALAAFCDLAVPKSWWKAFRGTLEQKSAQPFMTRLAFRPRAVSVQEHIEGRPANCALACWQGEVLASVSVEVLEVVYRNGPATVVQVIDHPEIAATAKRLVQQLGVTGLHGFDFILDSADRAWLLEMNPRTTPICHIPFADGTDLPAALYSRATGLAQPRRARPIASRTIALFPGEVVRSQSDQYLSSSHHDVPWEEPDFVRACLALKSTRRLRAQGRIREVAANQAGHGMVPDSRDQSDAILEQLRQLELR